MPATEELVALLGGARGVAAAQRFLTLDPLLDTAARRTATETAIAGSLKLDDPPSAWDRLTHHIVLALALYLAARNLVDSSQPRPTLPTIIEFVHRVLLATDHDAREHELEVIAARAIRLPLDPRTTDFLLAAGGSSHASAAAVGLNTACALSHFRNTAVRDLLGWPPYVPSR